MPEIRPFRGVFFDPSRVEIEKVVTPPYDVISPQEKLYYQSLSSYNMVYLSLEPDYLKVAERFERWLREGILKQDKRPAIYVYRQRFLHEGQPKVRLGFIARMRIADDGKLLPHENTFGKLKMDRLRLLQHVKANLSPIFSVFDDPQNEVGDLLREGISGRSPRLSLQVEGITHELWAVEDERIIRKVGEHLRRSYAFIADGHHRYESARIYRDLMRANTPGYTGEESFNFVMNYFVSISDEGLVTLPTHRILLRVKPEDVERRIEGFFQIEEVEDLDDMFDLMRTRSDSRPPAIGIYDGRRFRVLTLKDRSFLDDSIPKLLRDLDVMVLHSLIIPPGGELQFTHDSKEVVKLVKENPPSFGFFLNPIKPEKIREIALAGERMPHKSTYFYPKPLSGLVINRHD